MKLGIVANEFFSNDIGRMGGFGWAARQVAETFNQRPYLGVSVVFLAANLKSRNGTSHTRVHDTLLLFAGRGQAYRERIRAQNFDLILTIDYRPSYRRILELLSSTPVIVWGRDPRPAAVQAKLATLRFPNDGFVSPPGIETINCTCLSEMIAAEAQRLRPVLFATPALTLSQALQHAYGILDTDFAFLPNIVDLKVETVTKSRKPRVVFVGRLDPIKRPWLFVELARGFPEVEFLMLGQSHFHKANGWYVGELPENVKILGHVDGLRKRGLMSSAWLVVNTSIHESLATSFLEALACETPLLSCNNTEGIVSRFGVFIGSWDGDGMSSIPAFAAGLRELIENPEKRTQLGREGRQWVERTHNATAFLNTFDELCTRAGIDRQLVAH